MIPEGIESVDEYGKCSRTRIGDVSQTTSRAFTCQSFSASRGHVDENFTAVSVDDQWQYVDEWRDAGDRAVEFGPIPIGTGELLPRVALDQEPPDRARLTEASGNEGASYERSYHRAALVLWRRDRYADVLLQAGGHSRASQPLVR